MRDFFVRFCTVAFGLICTSIIVMCVAKNADAIPSQPDESIPELVDQYILMPCDAMEMSYEFMYSRIIRLSEEYKNCVSQATNSVEKYPGLMCVWIRQEFYFLYDHMVSMSKAYTIMCDPEDGQRKQPEYEIDF